MNTPSPDSPQNVCPKCGRPIPEGSPRGLCPLCLISEVAKEDSPAASTPGPELDELRRAFPTLEIVEPLGTGGMGRVYKVRQPHLDRFCALKLLPPAFAEDPAWVERFTREARALARLNHPGIVQVYDFGEASSVDEAGAAKRFPFLLMEFVDGVNLRQALRSGNLTAAEALTIVPPICAALQYAHNQGVLHRDIKPENILLDVDGRVKIADFGVAKLAGAPNIPGATLTATGAQLGTAAYMAPEQIERPQDVDHRADIFSLGVVFYELLTGELPLGRFPAPSEKAGTDPRLDTIVFRTLEKERERRFQTAGEVKSEVEHVTSSQPPPMPPIPPVGAAGAQPSPVGLPTPVTSRKTVALVLSLVMLPFLLAGLALLLPMVVRPRVSWVGVPAISGVLLAVAVLTILGFTWLFRRLQLAGVSTGFAAVIVALGLIILPPAGCVALLVPTFLGYRSAQRAPESVRQFQLQLSGTQRTSMEHSVLWKVTSQTPVWVRVDYGELSANMEPREVDGRFIVEIEGAITRRIAPNTSSFRFSLSTGVGGVRRDTEARFSDPDATREFSIVAVDGLHTPSTVPITIMRAGDVPVTVTVSSEPLPIVHQVQLTVTDVSMTEEQGDLLLNVDYVAQGLGDAGLYFKEDGLAPSFETLAPGEHPVFAMNRRTWKFPASASMGAGPRAKLLDRIKSQYLQKTIAIPKGQLWEFFRVQMWDGKVATVSIGARDSSLEPQ